jgi:hypothetical protein
VLYNKYFKFLILILLFQFVSSQSGDDYCGTLEGLQAFFEDPNRTRDARPEYELSIGDEDDDSNFVVHYTLTGPSAVTLSHAEAVLEKAEEVYQKYLLKDWIELPPDCDENIQDDCDDYEDDSKYDIYFVYNPDPTIKGKTHVERPCTIENECASEPFTQGYTSWIEIVPGELPNTATIPHELHHAIQISYAPISGGGIWFYEATATYMPTVIDNSLSTIGSYLQWTNLDNPLTKPNYPIDTTTDLYEYTCGLWNKFLVENYQDSSIVRTIWEEIGQSGDGLFDIFDEILTNEIEPSSSLSEAFEGYSIWRYFTGDRSIPGEYFYEASLYPTSTILTGNRIEPEAIQLESQRGGTYFVSFNDMQDPDMDLNIYTEEPEEFSLTVIKYGEDISEHTIDYYSLSASPENVEIPYDVGDNIIIVPVADIFSDGASEDFYITYDISDTPQKIVRFANELEDADIGHTLSLSEIGHISSNSSIPLIIGETYDIQPSQQYYESPQPLYIHQHIRWNEDIENINITNTFEVTLFTDEEVAQYLNAANVEIKSNAIDILGIHNPVEIRDPWFIDPTSGLQLDEFILVETWFADEGMNYAHLDMVNDPPDPFYSLKTPLLINSETILEFDHWSINNTDDLPISPKAAIFTTGQEDIFDIVFYYEEAEVDAQYIEYYRGDVNQDAGIDNGDIVLMVAFVLETRTPNEYHYLSGDVNSDTSIDILDVVIMTDCIVNNSTIEDIADCLNYWYYLERLSNLTGNAIVSINSSQQFLSRGEVQILYINIDSEEVIKGFQFDLVYDPLNTELTEINLTEISFGFELAYNEIEYGITRVIAYPIDEFDIPAGNHDVLVASFTNLSRMSDAPQYSYDNAIVVGENGMQLNIENNQTNKIPETYKLSNIYPNPFNSITTIEFELPEDSIVSMTIYDISGRIIEELVNGNLNAGYNQVLWNADNRSSGIYFVRLHAGSYNKTSKLVLIK